MSIAFEHQPHPWVAERKEAGPGKHADEHVGINGKIAVLLTGAVGTMWCAYAFAILALIALPAAIKAGDPLALVQWISQTFLQLVLLSVIIVGQNIASRASDKRAEMTYKDAEAILHDAEQIQAHLKAQDEALSGLIDKMLALQTTVDGPPTPTT
jgi:hypothetical protein